MRATIRARRRLRTRRLQARLAGPLQPPGSFIPHRRAARTERRSEPLRLLFEAARPAFAQLLSMIEAYGPDLARFGGPAPAPRFEQDWFPGLDAATLYTIVRTRRPRRIVEIGSGHSTRVMARAVLDEGSPTDITAIDPAPRAPLEALDVIWQRSPLQDVDPAIIDTLGAGDILFLDSSHILFAGSDVAFAFTELLPRLARGTLLHVHDVFLPDPYPELWRWRGYNEQQAVAALLLGGFELVFASHFVRVAAADLPGPAVIALHVPEGAFETSLWLRRR